MLHQLAFWELFKDQISRGGCSCYTAAVYFMWAAEGARLGSHYMSAFGVGARQFECKKKRE
jgi:hypothetical protein